MSEPSRGDTAAQPVSGASFLASRDVFLRLLGVVHLIAFGSLWVQIIGLIGRRGILPVSVYLPAVREQLGNEAWWRAPTLCWISTGDAFLHALCASGVVGSILLIIGLAPRWLLLGLWVVYLSLVVAGQEFLSFQWDTLLLETTVTAIFLAPAGWRLRGAVRRAPSRAGLWLARLLLFKLMFLSGITKLLSGDASWRDGSAMDVHFETQPIPAWTSWFVHQFPAWTNSVATIGMFAVEIIAPFLLFGPRRVRHIGVLLIAGLQVLIAATGNYGFFNLLALVLCVPMLDDRALMRCVPARWRRAEPALVAPRGGGRAAARVMAAWFLAILSSFALARELVRAQQPDRLPRWALVTLDAIDAVVVSWADPAVLRRIDSFRTVNGYGLFRVMTVERPEIIIEARYAGDTWRAYEFRWKAGDPERRPRFVAPHMPRLDWQMWFAGLNPRGNARWLERLALALLEGRPEVVGLIGEDPFEDGPPQHVQFVYYRYEFTDAAERDATGAWWKRERIGLYGPLNLRDFGEKRGE